MASNIISQPSKACTRCGVVKHASCENFSATKRGVFGLNAWCKPCMAEWRRIDRAAKPEHYAEIERRRYQKNRESRLEMNRRIRQANLERYLAANRERHALNRDKINADKKAKRDTNPEIYRERCREWNKNNAELLSRTRREKWRVAPKQKRLRTYMGAAIAHALAGRGKGGRGWQDLVGYRTSDLVRHLERQFARGMTWENYGPVWHVDHIIPASSFHYETPDDAEFRACWALTNLRPLWADKNISKGNKRLTLL